MKLLQYSHLLYLSIHVFNIFPDDNSVIFFINNNFFMYKGATAFRHDTVIFGSSAS